LKRKISDCNEKIQNQPPKSDMFSFAGVKLKKVHRASSSDFQPLRNKKRKVTPQEIQEAVRMKKAAVAPNRVRASVVAQAPQANDLMGLALGKKAKKHTLGADWLRHKQRRGIKVTNASDEQKSDEGGLQEKKPINLGTAQNKTRNKGDDGSNSSSVDAFMTFEEENSFDPPQRLIPGIRKHEDASYGCRYPPSRQAQFPGERKLIGNDGRVFGDTNTSLKSDYDLVGRMLADEEKLDEVSCSIGIRQKGKHESSVLKQKRINEQDRIKEILLRKRGEQYLLHRQESKASKAVSWKDGNIDSEGFMSDSGTRNSVIGSPKSPSYAASCPTFSRRDSSAPVATALSPQMNATRLESRAGVEMPMLPVPTELTARKILEDHGWTFAEDESGQKVASISRKGNNYNASESTERAGASPQKEVHVGDRSCRFEKVDHKKSEFHAKAYHTTKTSNAPGESRILGKSTHADVMVGKTAQPSKQSLSNESPLKRNYEEQSYGKTKHLRFTPPLCARGDSAPMRSESDSQHQKLSSSVASHVCPTESIGRSSNDANLMKKAPPISGVGRGKHMTRPAWQNKAEATGSAPLVNAHHKPALSSSAVSLGQDATKPAWQNKAGVSESIEIASILKAAQVSLSSSGIGRGKHMTRPAWQTKVKATGSAPLSSSNSGLGQDVTKPERQHNVEAGRSVGDVSIVKGTQVSLSSASIGRGKHMTRPAWQTKAEAMTTAPLGSHESGGGVGPHRQENQNFDIGISKARSSIDASKDFGQLKESFTAQKKEGHNVSERNVQGARTATPTRPSPSRLGRELGKRNTPCRFFFTPKGCRRGMACHFSHERNTKEEYNGNMDNDFIGDNHASPENEWLQHEDPVNPKIFIRDVRSRGHRTVLLKNLPREYTRPMLFDELLNACGFAKNEAIDCVHLPENDIENFGYAIVHLQRSFQVVRLLEIFDRRRWDNFDSEQRAEVTYAAPFIQGRKALVDTFGTRVIVSDVGNDEAEDAMRSHQPHGNSSPDSCKRSPDKRFRRRQMDTRW